MTNLEGNGRCLIYMHFIGLHRKDYIYIYICVLTHTLGGGGGGGKRKSVLQHSMIMSRAQPSAAVEMRIESKVTSRAIQVDDFVSKGKGNSDSNSNSNTVLHR